VIIIYDYCWIAEKSRASITDTSFVKFYLIELSKVHDESMISFAVSRNRHQLMIMADVIYYLESSIKCQSRFFDIQTSAMLQSGD